MGSDSGALTGAAFDFERTAGLFHTLAHAQDSEVPCGCEAGAVGFEAQAIVLNVEADSACAETQPYVHFGWIAMDDRITDRFAGDQKQGATERIRQSFLRAIHPERHEDIAVARDVRDGWPGETIAG